MYRATGILNRGLCKPCNLAPVVDHVGITVRSTQRWQWLHETVMPVKRQACIIRRRKAKGIETAEILAIRVCCLCASNGPSALIHAKAQAIRSSQSGRA